MFANKINVPAWVLCLLRQVGSLSRKNLCGRRSLVNQQRDMLVLGAYCPRRCCGSWKDFQVLAECILAVSPSWQASFLPPALIQPVPTPTNPYCPPRTVLCLIRHLQSLLFSPSSHSNLLVQLHGTFCSFPNRPQIFFIDLCQGCFFCLK